MLPIPLTSARTRSRLVLVFGWLLAGCGTDVAVPAGASESASGSGAGAGSGASASGASASGGSGGSSAGSGAAGAGGAVYIDDCALPLGPDVFDPSRMYVLGTISEGSGDLDVFCDVMNPEPPSMGFPPFASGVMSVRPTDCRLLYAYEGAVREFRHDTTSNLYPTAPLDNDIVVPTPGCTEAWTFEIDPVSGAMVHGCDGVWFDAQGNPFEACGELDELLALDGHGAKFCGDFVVDGNGVSHPIELPSPGYDELFVVRAKPGGGFWGVRNVEGETFERWTVASDGTATLDGTYAPLPPGTYAVNADVPDWGNLDRSGNFYRWVREPEGEGLADSIARMSGDFTTSEIVFDDTRSTCKLHAFSFVTSP